jgi:membrane-bound lytic murein transglycosylase A
VSLAGRRFGPALAGAFLMAAAPQGAEVGGAALVPVSFTDLDGWAADDHAAAFAAFRASCPAVLKPASELRRAREADPALARLCAETLKAGPLAGPEARAFFESRFRPFWIHPPAGTGFLTGYYEPEFAGSRQRTEAFTVPLLDRPADLVTAPAGGSLPGVDPSLQAARRLPSGALEPYPDRAAIEDGALGPLARPVAFVREPGEAFIIHVQGSARIRLPDGSVMRLAYAGRNGQPYTSIGRILAERGDLPVETMTLERLMGWLEDHPAEARALMRRNRSYIFFREAPELPAGAGPIGGAGIPLIAGRSLAVDRALWSYGLPFWLEGALPVTLDTAEPLRRLMVAHDTGSAIVGPARGDFFVGSGAEAGTRAGLLRHPTRFVVLLPRP